VGIENAATANTAEATEDHALPGLAVMLSGRHWVLPPFSSALFPIAGKPEKGYVP
jgi:hypothetical protein